MFEESFNLVLACLGGYFVTSTILLKYPSLIHKKKVLQFTCKHISHRGGAGENYENTLTAFKRAASIGTDMLELDCQMTKDNQVVVCHDNNLMRVAGVNQNISDMEYKDLPLLKKSLPVDFAPGVTFEGSGLEDERKIPLLSEVFKEFPNMPINIDIKTNNDLLIKEVDRLVTSYNREGLTVWGNFSDKITWKCYRQNPNINILCSLRKVIQVIMLFYTGLLPFIPLKETHLELFRPALYLDPSWREEYSSKEPPFMVTWPPFILKTLDFFIMRKSLFQHLSKRGIETYLWVVNDESQFQTVFDLGITGIMTDYPTRLRKFLDEIPQSKMPKVSKPKTSH